jgi:hypothetical protein
MIEREGRDKGEERESSDWKNRASIRSRVITLYAVRDFVSTECIYTLYPNPGFSLSPHHFPPYPN